MTLKSDAKFEEKLTLGSKNDMKNLMNFNASSGKSENLHFDVLLLSKVCYVWATKEELCAMTLKNGPKFEKWHNEFGEFWRSTQNFHFNGAPFDQSI